MSLDFTRNHFDLFGLTQTFALDTARLDQAYRDIQAEIHPDRFAHAGESEQRLAMQWATKVNEAYQTLKKPFERARYLLSLNGVDAMDAQNTFMPADFLMRQMEWREALEDARAGKDLAALESLERTLRWSERSQAAHRNPRQALFGIVQGGLHEDLRARSAAEITALEFPGYAIGGVSVGELDFVKAAFEELGGKLEFWKVAIKPGKPFVFGKLGSKLLFGLPGNPVSALVTFLLLARPALWRWQGATDVEPRTIPCTLGEPLVNRGGRRHFMRVRLDANGVAWSSGLQASHRLMSLAEASALVDVPPDTTLAAGASARVIGLDG